MISVDCRESFCAISLFHPFQNRTQDIKVVFVCVCAPFVRYTNHKTMQTSKSLWNCTMMIFISVRVCCLFHWPCLPHSTILSIYHLCPTLRTFAFTIIHRRHYTLHSTNTKISPIGHTNIPEWWLNVIYPAPESIRKMNEKKKKIQRTEWIINMKRKNINIWFVISHLPMFIVWMIPKQNTRIRVRSRLVQRRFIHFESTRRFDLFKFIIYIIYDV